MVHISEIVSCGFIFKMLGYKTGVCAGLERETDYKRLI